MEYKPRYEDYQIGSESTSVVYMMTLKQGSGGSIYEIRLEAVAFPFSEVSLEGYHVSILA
jgi:hypothetical protein